MLDGIVADLHAFIAKEKIAGAAVVGHSMGGLAAMMLAKAHPTDADKLMIVDSLPFIGTLYSPAATTTLIEPQARAMREAQVASYGKPVNEAAAAAIADRLAAMKAAGCERILLAPLYPQYCAATTATANDKAFAYLAGLRWQPAIRTLPPYYDDSLYIDALAEDLETSLAALDFTPDAIVASFHGMPKRTLQLGDPYHCHCQKTARLLSEKTGRDLTIAFQSRFGPQKWLGPATDETLVALAQAGKTRVAIFAPGFSADCLETLEELSIRGRESFEEAGGTHFAYLPCLNDGPAGLAMLRALLARELEGWVARG